MFCEYNNSNSISSGISLLNRFKKSVGVSEQPLSIKEKLTQGAKNLGERLPALLKSTDAEDKVGLGAIDIIIVNANPELINLDVSAVVDSGGLN